MKSFFQQLPFLIFKQWLSDRAIAKKVQHEWGKKRWLLKGVSSDRKTKQRDGKWTKVTWLEWPLHINVISIINNFGEKHIQLSVHWSPLAWETANSHGVGSWEYHLTVALPCVGLLVLSVQQWRSRLWFRLNVLKPSLPVQSLRTASPLHCVCLSAGLRALLSGAEIWQSQQVMTEAVVRSHPEPQRRLTFQGDERLVQYTEHKGTDQRSLRILLFCKSHCSATTTFMFTCGWWECWTFVNFWTF